MGVEVPDTVEAIFTNLSAGMILTAVGLELFPLMAKEEGLPALGSITFGFLMGLALVYGSEPLVEKLVGSDEEEEEDEEDISKHFSHPDGHDSEPGSPQAGAMRGTDNGEGEGSELLNPFSSPISPRGVSTQLSTIRTRREKYEDGAVQEAHDKLMAMPEHRLHIREHLVEISESILAIRNRSKALYGTGAAAGLTSPMLSPADRVEIGHMTVPEMEESAEFIDETVHRSWR